MNTPPAPSPLSASGRVAAATGRLSRHLALAYAALIIYASLHPFSGWRDSPQHNRVLLQKSATRIGIATAYAPGSKYKVYWALIVAE